MGCRSSCVKPVITSAQTPLRGIKTVHVQPASGYGKSPAVVTSGLFLRSISTGADQNLLQEIQSPEPARMGERGDELNLKIRKLVEGNSVVIFSKTTCPFCSRVKQVFSTLGVQPTVYELDSEDDGAAIQEQLYIMTKQKTVPNVFINGRHVGGCDDTLKLVRDGSIGAMFQGGQTQLQKIDQLIAENHVVVFSKTTCPYCVQVKELFSSLGIRPMIVELDRQSDGVDLQNALVAKTNQRTVPNVFVRGNHVGGCDNTMKAHQSGLLMSLLEGEMSNEVDDGPYDYDLLVLGGGSGGLAAAKEAAQLGKKVALCDFVKPTPQGTTWGLGGTCVNVGCIPKKLMHQASLHREHGLDSRFFGWAGPGEDEAHNWETMVENVQNYIKSLNFGYRKELNKRKVKYYNSYGVLTDAHTVQLTNKKGEVENVTTRDVIIAVGGRPAYPDIPGARELCITSDDIFSLPSSPGRTLIVGASYIALECGGFLCGLGYDVTIMVRSILLRGFDRQMADLIGAHMEHMGVNFVRDTVPIAVTKNELGKLQVTARTGQGETVTLDGYDTVVLAIGREACTSSIGLDNVPVKLNPKNKKIIVDEFERSSVPNIYAIGDVLDGKPELTPVAIHAGKFLAQRMAGVHKRLTNYKQVPTTVFTPLEYGCVGLSEEEAISIFSDSNIVVYHNAFKPLEHALSREMTVGYAKLVCVKSLNELVVGFHVVSPNAGEITQGFAIALKLGAKKSDFDDLIGIHPTTAEVFTTLSIVKNPGDAPPETSGC